MEKKGMYPNRLLRIVLGEILFGLNIYLVVRANVGLSPAEALHYGIQMHVNLSYGTVMNLVTLGFLAAALIMGESIGLGTAASLLAGLFADVFFAVDFLSPIENFWVGILVMIAAQFVLAFGTYFYMSAQLGCGPRDALMTAIAKRLPGAKVGVIRGTIECVSLLLGFLLGSKVGIGTLIAVFGVGTAIQTVFTLLRFDITKIRHENLIDTARAVISMVRKEEQ